MAYLNAMDKHFFGKTLVQWARDNAKFVSNKKVKPADDSFDDFFKHVDVMYRAFHFQKSSLEKSPKRDVFNKVQNSKIEPDSYRDFLGSMFGQ